MRISVALIAVALAASQAHALDQKDVDACRSGEPNAQVEACGRIADDTTATVPERARAAHRRGLARQELGDAANAMDDFTQAIELDPKFAVAYVSRGAVFLELYEPDRAIADLNEAIKLEPKLAIAYDRRGMGYGYAGDPTSAVKDFDTAIGLVRRFSLGRLVSATYTLDEYDTAIAHAANAGPRDAVKLAFDMREQPK
jgi:tetratricopeptide (TPR) repeat protein